MRSPLPADPTRTDPSRGRWRWTVVLLAAVVSMLAPPSASAEDPVGCGYGTGGPYAPNLCWFDMSGYSDAQARSAAGQQMSITLPGGYVVEFTLTSRAVPSAAWRGVESRTAPLEARFAFGVSGYAAIPGKPVLYSQGGTGPNGVELKLSDITVVDSGGQPVTGYSFVIADAENNVAGENFTWTSDKPLNLVGVLNEKVPAGCHNGLSGLGTTSVTCTGQGGETGLPNPRYDAVLVGADTPSSVALSMKTFARSGVAFAIMTSKVQLTKEVVGRVRATDSFDVSVTSPEGSTLAAETTGPADVATTGELTVLPLSSGASYTLSEAVTPASGTRASDYSRSWSCTDNGVADPSLPSGGGPSVSVSPEVGDFIACTVTNTQLPADLSVEKAVSAEAAAAGDRLTYSIEVENHGPSGADSVLLEDVLPAGVAYVSDDAGCDTSAPPAIECDLGTLLDGESRSVQIVADVQPGAAGSLQTNSAEVDALQPDDEPENDESSAATAVAPFSDLAIVKSVSPEVIGSPGEQVTYTLEVENLGELGADPATVTDTLPPGLAYVSDDGGCDITALPTVTCDLGALAKGESRTVHVIAEVEGSAAGKAIENTASVAGSHFDPDPTNNEASATVEVEPLSDLAITKTPSASGAKPGDTVTYQLIAENDGPTSDLVTVTDTLPPGLAYVSDDGGCDITALPTVTCDLGALADGESRTIQLLAEVVAAAGTIENTAQVSGENPDPEPANNSSVAETTIEPVSDLAIAKTASSPAVKPGETLTYTLEAENRGPSASGPTTVTDTLPAGLTYVSDDAGCAVAAQREISCSLGTLDSGSAKAIHVVVAVSASATGAIENTAEVTGPNPDPTPGDNEASESTAVTPLAADLALTKSAPGSTVRAGDQVTYTLVASNHGPDPSPQTVLTDTLPAGLAYVSDDGGCDTSALPRIECDLGTLADGESRTVRIVTAVTATDGEPIRNEARVSGMHPDPDPGNNPDAAQTPAAPVAAPPAPPAPPSSPPAAPATPKKQGGKKGAPRLVLTKRAGAAAARPGSVVGYRITVANRGDGPARRVVVCDHPPAAQRTLRTEPRATGRARPCWKLAKLAAGAERTFRLTAMVDPGSGRGVQRNRATVRAANAKGVRADTATVRVKPLPQAGCLARPLAAGPPPEIEFLC